MNVGWKAESRARGRQIRAARTRSGARPTPRRFPRLLATSSVVALLAFGGLLAGGYWYAQRVERNYGTVRADIAKIERTYDLSDPPASMSPDQLAPLARDLAETERHLRDLDRRLDAPLIGSVASRLPKYGNTYRASAELVQLGLDLVSIARDAADIGAATFAAYQQTGPFHAPERPGPTWLDVLAGHRREVEALSARFDDALQRRASLDVQHVSGRALPLLAQADRLLVDARGVRDTYLPLLDLMERALGAREDARYLILLGNSLELHQAGGFPGTYALLTLRRGQVLDFRIENIHDLDERYVENRDAVLPAPAPIRAYIGQRELLPHDANWLPDFPSAGRLVAEMYATTGEPPILGIVSVESDVARQVLQVLGPLDVTIDGQPFVVDASNVITTIETFRSADERHKHVVAIIGDALVSRARAMDGRELAAVADILLGAAERRDIQAYAGDAQLQEVFAARGWDGALVPDPATPTLALTVSNLTPNKSSGYLVVASTLDLVGEGMGAITRAEWTIRLTHTGDPRGDPDYNGPHRSWVAIYAPDAASVESSRIAAPDRLRSDPREHAYLIDVAPGETQLIEIEIEFSRPVAAVLLRRQAGLNDMLVRVRTRYPGCETDSTFLLSHDRRIDVTACIALDAGRAPVP